MKTVQVTLLIEDAELEERIENLEERCDKLGISLQNIFQAIALTMPNRPFIDILLSMSDIKIDDIESNEKIKQFWNKLKIHKKSKGEEK